MDRPAPYRRAVLAGMLWPELTDRRAAHNLSQTLLRLRRALGEQPASAQPASPQAMRPQAAREPFLSITPQDIQFNPRSDYQLDVALLTELLRASGQHQHPDAQACATCMDWLRQAADLYRGDFLAGFFVRDSVGFEEWRLVQQEGLHRQAVDLLSRLATYHEGRGEDEQVGRYAGQLAALEKYAAYCRVLDEEFGLPPSAEARALCEQIESGQVGREASRPAPDRRLAAGDRRQVTALVRGHRDLAAGVAGDRALPAEVRRRIVAQTDGVPLFVEECTRTILDRPDPEESKTGRALQIPATLRDSLMARLDHAGPAQESGQWAAAQHVVEETLAKLPGVADEVARAYALGDLAFHFSRVGDLSRAAGIQDGGPQRGRSRVLPGLPGDLS